MLELPLFPLNAVLFPGMPIYLQIFEDRYKRMIAVCLEKQQPFGVVLIRQGQEALGPLAEPQRVGCTTQVAKIELLGEGRIKLMGIGQDRFRIISLKRDEPYLVGQVELYAMQNDDPESLNAEGSKLRNRLERYLNILSAAGQASFAIDGLPSDPVLLAYLAATLLRSPPAQKEVRLGTLVEAGETFQQPASALQDFTAQQQMLLESPDVVTMLADLSTIYRREITILSSILSPVDEDTSSCN